jgi:hypothetical protein
LQVASEIFKMGQQNRTWNLGRFIQTLTYYEVIPFLKYWNGFKNGLGQANFRDNPRDNPTVMIPLNPIAEPTMSHPSTHLPQQIFVADSIPAEALQRLTEQAAEQPHAIQRFSANVPPPIATLQQASAILLNFNDVTPALLQAIAPLFEPVHQPVFDFRQSATDLQAVWGVLDDVVMGGVSESRISGDGAIAEFSGNVSTANSGGFASVRTRNFDPPIDLSAYEGIFLKVKGDGKRYKVMLRPESCWDGVAYCHSFDTMAAQWITVYIPFDQFIPVVRAKTIAMEALNPKAICAFQLMLSKFEYDGALNPHFLPGYFRLQVEAMGGYGRSHSPQLIVISPDLQPSPLLEQQQWAYQKVRSEEDAIASLSH